MNVRQFFGDVSKVCDGDHIYAFKILGFITYLVFEGNEALLSGEIISQKTYYRWREKVVQAGWGNYLLDVQLKKALTEYIIEKFRSSSRLETRPKLLRIIDNTLDQMDCNTFSDDMSQSPQAERRKVRRGVKGEQSESAGFTLDSDAACGSLGKATATEKPPY